MVVIIPTPFDQMGTWQGVVRSPIKRSFIRAQENMEALENLEKTVFFMTLRKKLENLGNF